MEVGVAGAAVVEEGGEIGQGQGDGDGAHHALLNPAWNGAFAVLPVDQRTGGAAEFSCEFIAGQAAGFAELAELIGGHWQHFMRDFLPLTTFFG